ncbi:BolA family protein [Lutibaculum baratangense]|uniref:Cell division protein BolA n=1 Tax=Lutibaculum baratangense AMV1 TaxID=631454 RepID=V4TCT1_9HYPH|nr:BolA family protein [Lutibaculum baratangense]ESR24108.1 Cell division protein BolA [Lutibaculum baratangense AMV1]
MSRRDRIAALLETAFSPERMEILDESHLHHGHAGWREGGETHYRVLVVSSAFEAKNLIERHRMVNEALKPELDAGLHALAITARAPGEA